MGRYLSTMDNKKGNSSGSMPDENYAREVMQLFSIGLVKLNLDGTPALKDGVQQPTYTQEDVTQLARVFTGWGRAPSNTGDPAYLNITVPMVNNDAEHEPGASSFLGITVPAGTNGETSLHKVINTLMNQASMAPFISRQLIQRLVTSNPSPEYVKYVATAFQGDGTPAGKGDLKATILAIFMHPEASEPNWNALPERGKLREPMVRFIQWARTFGLRSADLKWDIGNLSDSVKSLGQSPLQSPSVFNFFRPGYVPAASALGLKGITAPEFQITTETTVSSYINFMQSAIGRGIGGMTADYSALMPFVNNSTALLDELNMLLAAGQISSATLSSLAKALATIDVSTTTGQNNRIYAALTLVMAAPEYIVQK